MWIDSSLSSGLSLEMPECKLELLEVDVHAVAMGIRRIPRVGVDDHEVPVVQRHADAEHRAVQVERREALDDRRSLLHEGAVREGAAMGAGDNVGVSRGGELAIERQGPNGNP